MGEGKSEMNREKLHIEYRGTGTIYIRMDDPFIVINCIAEVFTVLVGILGFRKGIGRGKGIEGGRM